MKKIDKALTDGAGLLDGHDLGGVLHVGRRNSVVHAESGGLDARGQHVAHRTVESEILLVMLSDNLGDGTRLLLLHVGKEHVAHFERAGRPSSADRVDEMIVGEAKRSLAAAGRNGHTVCLEFVRDGADALVVARLERGKRHLRALVFDAGALVKTDGRGARREPVTARVIGRGSSEIAKRNATISGDCKRIRNGNRK